MGSASTGQGPAPEKEAMRAYWDGQSGPYTQLVLEETLVKGLHHTLTQAVQPLLDPSRPLKFLDVASAGGEPACTLARAFPAAHVTATDYAPAFLPLARHRAASLGIPNIGFDTADGESLAQFGDGEFDLVTCCAGLMFMPDYHSALRSFRRVLRSPGGVLALVVWGALPVTPFMRLIPEWRREMGVPSPPDFNPTACRFGDPSELVAGLRNAGFGTVEVRQLDFTVSTPRWADLFFHLMGGDSAIKLMEEEGVAGSSRERGLQVLREVLQRAGGLTPGGELHMEGNRMNLLLATAE